MDIESKILLIYDVSRNSELLDVILTYHESSMDCLSTYRVFENTSLLCRVFPGGTLRDHK